MHQFTVSLYSVYTIQPCMFTVTLFCVHRTTMHQFTVSLYSVYTIQPCTSLQCHFSLCTPYIHAPVYSVTLFCVHHTTMDTLQCYFIRSHIRRMHVCLTATCHSPFWQNDRGLLRATAVTRGWNGYRNLSLCYVSVTSLEGNYFVLSS